METLLTAIVTWLSLNFALPATQELPRIERASAERIAAVRHGGALAERAPAAAADAAAPAWLDQTRDIEALYEDATRTIYLPQGWTGATPAEVSVLVHEMVHHLQNVAGLKYECAQARERPAYAAQDAWLARSGRSLADEFELDPMTVLLRTRCMG